MKHAQLQALEEKLQQLLTRYKRLQKENQNLKDDLHIAQKQLAITKNQTAELQQKVDVQNMGVQAWSHEEKQSLNKRIDVYLKDIQDCLNMLNA